MRAAWQLGPTEWVCRRLPPPFNMFFLENQGVLSRVLGSQRKVYPLPISTRFVLVGFHRPYACSLLMATSAEGTTSLTAPWERWVLGQCEPQQLCLELVGLWFQSDPHLAPTPVAMGKKGDSTHSGTDHFRRRAPSAQNKMVSDEVRRVDLPSEMKMCFVFPCWLKSGSIALLDICLYIFLQGAKKLKWK